MVTGVFFSGLQAAGQASLSPTVRWKVRTGKTSPKGLTFISRNNVRNSSKDFIYISFVRAGIHGSWDSNMLPRFLPCPLHIVSLLSVDGTRGHDGGSVLWRGYKRVHSEFIRRENILGGPDLNRRALKKKKKEISSGWKEANRHIMNCPWGESGLWSWKSVLTTSKK